MKMSDPPNFNRRRFLRNLAASGAAAGVAGISSPPAGNAAGTVSGGVGTLTSEQRQRRAFQIRLSAAQYHKSQLPETDAPNGDESLPRYLATFSKTLPHNDLGEVDGAAYAAYLRALNSGVPQHFEEIPMGSTGKLSNPQASYAFGLEGPDSYQMATAAPPPFSSAAMSAEMVEDYWLALTRDVSFADYGSSQIIQQAVTDLNRLSAFAAPKVSQKVNPDTIFRGTSAGNLTGPYISQFLLMPIPYGMIPVDQRYRTAVPGIDFMTSFSDWLSIQRGHVFAQPLTFDTTPRYIRNGRDLGSYVHSDFSYQAGLNAGLILNGFGGAAVSRFNPYKTSKTQASFATFGGPNVLDLVARVSTAALKATWRQKWLVHRRIRPEAFAARVHNHVTGAMQYPLDPEVLNSAALQSVYSRFGTYLLPQAYPEGSPAHPSFPAGHAALMGAAVTVLKAFFEAGATIPNPVDATADGLTLAPYTGAPLTIGGELDKLAFNIALGRDTAGVHFRSEGLAGVLLGEAVALGILRDLSSCYTENFEGFTITRFDGTPVTLCASCIP